MRRKITNADPAKPLLHSLTLAEIGSVDLASDDEAKWVHVASANTYLGYRGGSQPFVLTRAMFEQAVANLRAHPQFKVGPNGEGIADVVPWDFDHASETDPSERGFLGAPAQGWARDLKVVDGPGGVAELHALTRFLEPARTYVKAGKYKWASIAARFNGLDPVTGKDRGMTILSIALTNAPFIQGLQPLAASARFGGKKNMHTTGNLKVASCDGDVKASYWCEADTAEEAVNSLKDLFELPATAGVAELLAEVGKLRQWVADGTTPLGVDADELVGGIRQILGLDVLDGIAAVLDSVPGIVQRLIEENAMESRLPVPLSATGEDDMEILKLASTSLACRETEPAVRAAIEEHGALRVKLSKLLESRDDAGAILAAFEAQSAVSRQATADLAALHKALGVADNASAIDRVAKLSADSAELEKVAPQMKALKDKLELDAKTAAEAEVKALVAARGWDASLTEALLPLRLSDPEGFAKKYPMPKREQQHRSALTRDVVVGPNSAQLSATRAASDIGGAESRRNDGQVVDLSAYSGRNDTERAIAYLRSKDPSFVKLSWEDQCKAAFEFNRSNRAA